MTSTAITRNLVGTSRRGGFGRALAALRERLTRIAAALGRDVAAKRNTVEVGSHVRVFDVGTLREISFVVAPAGFYSTSPYFVPADSALARALLGGRAGDTRRWESHSGTMRARIVAVEGRVGDGGWRTAAARQAAA